jgi:hypothetical protein
LRWRRSSRQRLEALEIYKIVVAALTEQKVKPKSTHRGS